jgi:integrase
VTQDKAIHVTGRPDGRYVATVRTGKGKRKYIYGQSEDEVRQKVLEGQGGGSTGEVREVVVGELLDLWLESVKLQVRPTTYQTYRSYTRYHIQPPLVIIPARSLTPAHIENLLSVKSAHLSGSSIRNIRKVLSMCLRWGVRRGYLSSNPCELVAPVFFTPREIRVWTPEETLQFITSISEDPLEGMYLLAIGCGLRLGEIIGLRWGDLDLDNGTVTISRTAKRVNQEWVYFPPKTKAGRRTVGLPDKVKGVLIRHRSQTNGTPHPEDIVFSKPGRPGLPWHMGEVDMYYRWAKTKAKVPHARFHDLRHLCATLMFRNGVHPKVVQETLGHSNISITMDLYTKSVPTLQREAAQGMGKYLG